MGDPMERSRRDEGKKRRGVEGTRGCVNDAFGRRIWVSWRLARDSLPCSGAYILGNLSYQRDGGKIV